MKTTRRFVLSGLGASLALPAWAQSIGRQSDPWAQVDPYADERNQRDPYGQSAPQGRGSPGQPGSGQAGQGMFRASRDQGQNALGLTEDDEIAAGQAGYRYHLGDKKNPPSTNAVLQAALRDFTAPITARAIRSHLPWEITLIDTARINAWALPGGKMAVYGGIVSMCDTPGEFAGVIAHEVGHVDMEHWRRKGGVAKALEQADKQRRVTVNGVSDAAVAVPGLPGGMLSVADLLDNAYSQGMEYEADAQAFEMLEKLGMDTVHVLNMLKKLQKLSGDPAIHELKWTERHPINSERVAEGQRLFASSRRGSFQYDVPAWRTLKAAYPTLPGYRTL